MTSWWCIPPQMTLAIISPAVLLALLFYYILDKDRLKPYALLGSAYKKIKSSDSEASDEQASGTNPYDLSLMEKLSAARQILSQILALCSAYAAQYITVQAVFTTIAFGDAPFAPRDHYVYYVLTNSVGEFMLRSYLSIVAWYKPDLIERVVMKRTWIFSLLLLAIMIFSVCASYYHLFNSVWWVILFCFSIGSLTGLVFANTVCAVPFIVDPKFREFCMGLVTIGESLGILIASFAGLAVEPALRKHCSMINKDPSFCYTRHNRYGWNSAVCSAKSWTQFLERSIESRTQSLERSIKRVFLDYFSLLFLCPITARPDIWTNEISKRTRVARGKRGKKKPISKVWICF